MNRSELCKLGTSGQEAQGDSCRRQTSPTDPQRVMRRSPFCLCPWLFSCHEWLSTGRFVCCVFVECRKLPDCPAPCKEPSPQPQHHQVESQEPGQQTAATAHRWGPEGTAQWDHQRFALGSLFLFHRRSWQSTQDHVTRQTNHRLFRTFLFFMYKTPCIPGPSITLPTSQTSLSEITSFLQSHVSTILNTEEEQKIGKNIKVGHTQKNGS